MGRQKVQAILGVFIGEMGVKHEVVKKRYEILGNINILIGSDLTPSI